MLMWFASVSCKMVTMTLSGPYMYLFHHWATNFTMQKDRETEKKKRKIYMATALHN